MTAAELRKKLDEGLRADSSGKSTPIQRLTPFLQALVKYLEDREIMLFEMKPGDVIVTANENVQKVSSDDLSRSSLPPQTTSEQVGAPKPTA